MLEEKLSTAVEVARGGFGEVKRSVKGLVPTDLAEPDIHVAIHRLILDYEKSGIKVEFSCLGESLTQEAEVIDTVYRACQEALTNALRHGKAKQVSIILKNLYDKTKLYILDNGCGCKNIDEGMGLSGMRERVENVGGKLQFGSDGESGFYISIEIPKEKGVQDDSSNDCG